MEKNPRSNATTTFWLLVLKGCLSGCICHILRACICVLLPLSPAASLKQHSCFLPGHLPCLQTPEKNDWASCAGQIQMFNFPASKAKNLIAWCQSIPLTKHLWSRTWILMHCLLSVKARGELCHYTYWSEVQVSSAAGLLSSAYRTRDGSPVFLRLATTKQKRRRDIATETQTQTNTFAKKRKRLPWISGGNVPPRLPCTQLPRDTSIQSCSQGTC